MFTEGFEFRDWSNARIKKPPGDVSFGVGSQENEHTIDQAQLKTKKSWEIARHLSPIFATGFLCWMIPDQPTIIVLSVIIITLLKHARSLVSVNQIFAPFEDKNVSLILQKLVYCAIYLCSLSMLVWKLNKFGLLPVTEADRLPSYRVELPTERASGGALWE